jgi:hypothetical protein
MAGATITTLNNILKEFYLPPVVEQLNNEVLLLSRLEARSQELYGKAAFVPVHTSRSGGVGARAELGTLPTAGNQSYDRAQYDLKYLYGVVQVSGPSMAKTASEAGAFLKSLQSELDGIRNDLKKDTARQIYGTGDGVIATVGTGSTGTVVVLTTDEAIRKGQFYVGMLVDIGTVANPVSRATAQAITAVTLATPSITVAASGTPVNGEFVFRSGANAASSVTNEILGLQAIIATGTGSTLGQFASTFVGGIDSTGAGKDYWQAKQQSLATLNLDNMQKAWGAVRVAGGETSLMVGSFGVQRQYYGLLQSQVRFNEPMKLASGFQSLDFMGKELVADVDAPYGKLYFIDERFIKVFSNRDWHFLDEDGLVLKWVSNLDAWQSVLARYMNLGVSRRNTMLVGTGITDTTGV